MDDDKLYEESDERPHIKVTDRRKFAADGTPRSAPGESEAASEAAGEAAAPDAADTEPAEPTPEPSPEPSPEPAPEPAPTAESEDDAPRIAGPQPSIADLPRDFSAFIETLYLEAMLYLGAIPDPRSGQVMEDVELAKYKIDLLGMLQEKTRGNLSTDENQQLEEVLYQLRMLYLQQTQGPQS